MSRKAARAALRAAIARVEGRLRPLTRRAGIEDVHQARAAARELGDTLSTFGGGLPGLKEMSNLLEHASGEVRDLHVSGVRRGPDLSRATASMRKAIAEWERAQPRIEREVSGWVPSGHPRKLLRRRLRRLARRIDRLPTRIPARPAHRLRAKTRRAHTALGLVGPGDPKLSKRLKQASSLLGKLHDFDAGLTTGGRTRPQWLAEVRPALGSLRQAL